VLKIFGSVEFRNNKERKRLFKQLKDELGSDSKIWAEGYTLYYQSNANPDTIYL
jgi:hypothetical protein